MTLILLALLIAGHHFEWYWLIGTFVLDVIWLSIKLNFITVIIRRSVEEAFAERDQPPSP